MYQWQAKLDPTPPACWLSAFHGFMDEMLQAIEALIEDNKRYGPIPVEQARLEDERVSEVNRVRNTYKNR